MLVSTVPAVYPADALAGGTTAAVLLEIDLTLAYVLADQRAFDEAATAIARYAELTPGDPNPLDSQGEILLMAGRLDEAETAFRASLALDPTYRADGLAAVQLHRGELAVGIATLQEALRTAPPSSRFDVGYGLYWALLAAGRDDEALALVDTIEQAGVDAGILLPVGHAQVLRGRVAPFGKKWTEAATWFDAALATAAASTDPLAPEMAHGVTSLRLRAAMGAGDTATAEQLAELVYAGDPNDEVSQITRILMAHHRHDLPAALATLETLGAYRGFIPEARLLTAELLAEAGRVEEATALRQKVAAGYERDPRSVLWRQRAQDALGS